MVNLSACPVRIFTNKIKKSHITCQTLDYSSLVSIPGQWLTGTASLLAWTASLLAWHPQSERDWTDKIQDTRSFI